MKPITCKHCGKVNSHHSFQCNLIKKPIKPNQSVLKRSNKNINKVSQKQKERLKEYRIKRDEYFKLHPICEFPNCNSTDITLHHSKGRIGELLTDERYFKSLCFKHHRLIEENPYLAKELGLSFNRLDKNEEDRLQQG